MRWKALHIVVKSAWHVASNTVDAISDWTGRIVAWLVMCMVAAITYEVVARYGFNAPTIWAYDMTYMLYGTLFIMGAAYTLRHGAFIRVDVFYRQFSPRRKAIIESCMYLLFFFPPLIVLLWKGIDYIQLSWHMKECTIMTPWRVPIYPFKTMLPAGIGLLLLQGVVDFIRNLGIAVRGVR